MILSTSALILFATTIVAAQSSNPSILDAHCPGAELVNSTTLQLGDNVVKYTRYYCAENVPVDDPETVDSGDATSDTPATTDSGDATSDTPAMTDSGDATSDTPVTDDSAAPPTPDPTDSGSSLRRRGFFDHWPLCLLFHKCKYNHFPPIFHPPKPPPPPPKPRNVCGGNCTVACNNNVGVLPPVAEDCATIQASFQIFSSELASTFTTEPNHFESLIFGTCTIFFNNLGKSDLEYCWNDFGSVSAIAGGPCFPPAHPPFSEGLCTSKDRTWAVGISHS